jgi:hypothetical protein
MIACHLGELSELLALRDFESDEIDYLLRGQTVPDTYISMVGSVRLIRDNDKRINDGTNEPSHAITRNSSSSVMSCTDTSGSAVMICFSGGNEVFSLYLKSPRARDKARSPGISSTQNKMQKL